MGEWAQTLGSIVNPSSSPGGTPPFVPGSSGGGGGGFLSNLFKWLPIASLGAGTIGNIQANRARNQVLSSEMAQMRMLEKLTPAQISQGIAAIQQPLSRNLVNNVSNTVQGEMAQRGLSQAPGIFAQAIGQGLAPYQLQEQQLAQDAFFKKLGLPIQARPSPFGPFPQTVNQSQNWQAILSRFMRPGGGGGGLPNDQSIYGPAEGSIIQSIIGGPPAINDPAATSSSGPSTFNIQDLLSFNPSFATAGAGGG